MITKKDTKRKQILEIGGATGELSLLLQEKFPESQICLNDISKNACKIAEEKGLQSICSSIANLELSNSYTTVIALDVLYYESELAKCFKKITSSLLSGGLLIMRFPNKYKLINLLSGFSQSVSYTHLTLPTKA